MQPVRTPVRPGGWPHWVLWAAAPLVLSVGFVTGMALATYLPEKVPPVAQAPAPPVPTLPAAADPPAPPRPDPTAAAAPTERSDGSWRIPSGTTPQPAAPPSVVVAPPIPLEPIPEGFLPEQVTLPAEPRSVYGAPVPLQDFREARALLSKEFGRHPAGFSVDYQQMRQAARGVSMVGLISVADYPTWEQAVQRDEAGLKVWLEAAAHRILVASARERFHLVWAVVDVVPQRPRGFADYELTPLENGSFLVIRPLAATQDHVNGRVVLRSTQSLALSVAGRPLATDTPWATYGPVIRFDNTDLYRPQGLAETRPRR